ncbi:MAG: hypothetical protein K940chlam8_00007 [Chlamydiae bacterium]|nr:hypothetical protein [Chlamydiota bacterium]
MKFLDSFSYFVMAILFLVVGGVVNQTTVWSPSMNGIIAWLAQAFAFALAIVGTTCLITNKKVKELSAGAVTWSIALVVLIVLVGVFWMDMYTTNQNVTMTAVIELIIFFVILFSLFVMPRKYHR